MSANEKVSSVFKESLDKLNSMLMFLDTQLGTVSLSKEEIDSLGMTNKHQPLANIAKDKKEEKKKEKKEDKKEEKKHEKKEKKEETKKEEGKKKEQKKKQGTDKNELFSLCDLRVGKVIECKILEGFNDVYALKIDLGEPEPRIIGTGLRHYVPQEEIQDSKVIVFSNLKPKRFGTTFTSCGMIMCASVKNEETKEVIEIIRPNEASKPGDKVYLEGTTLNKEVVPTITGGKFGKAIELFATDAECKCMYNGTHMLTESGNITVKTLKNAHIS